MTTPYTLIFPVVVVPDLFLPSVSGLVKIIGKNQEIQGQMCGERQLKRISEILDERSEEPEDIRLVCHFVSKVVSGNGKYLFSHLMWSEDAQNKVKKAKILAKLWNLLHAKVDPASPASQEKSKQNESFIHSILESTTALCEGNRMIILQLVINNCFLAKNAETWYMSGKTSSKLLFSLLQHKNMPNIQIDALNFLAILAKSSGTILVNVFTCQKNAEPP